jgi:uncharacterized protein YjbJ (UPF0337 family)
MFDGGTNAERSRCYRTKSEDKIMHKDRMEGAGKQAKGAMKDAAGGLTGNTKMQAEGKADKAAGKIQSAVGKAKDKARDALKH